MTMDVFEHTKYLVSEFKLISKVIAFNSENIYQVSYDEHYVLGGWAKSGTKSAAKRQQQY